MFEVVSRVALTRFVKDVVGVLHMRANRREDAGHRVIIGMPSSFAYCGDHQTTDVIASGYSQTRGVHLLASWFVSKAFLEQNGH